MENFSSGSALAEKMSIHRCRPKPKPYRFWIPGVLKTVPCWLSPF